jgi:signal transduction histidine kinase
VFAVSSAGLSLLPLDGPEDPEDPAFRALFWVSAVSLTGLGLAVTALTRAEWRRTSAVARLADTLDAEPTRGGIKKVLSQALGDPGLEVVFRLPGTGSIVDRDGRPANQNPTATAEVPIVRDGEILAVVRHDADPWGTINLDSEIGAAVRLAVDNERLRANLAAQLAELRESRLRVVARADAERRRLERNLHDGAQQALLAVAYELGLAASEVRSAGDEALAADVAGARDQVRTVLEELRRLAQGIYPTVLTDAGVAAALWSLADRTDARVDVVHVPAQRAPAATERVAYLVAEYGIQQALRRGVQAVAVDIRLQDGGPVRVTVEPCSCRPGPEILDRVETIGGRIDVTDRALHAEVPCV